MASQEKEEPICSICGYSIYTGTIPGMWLQDAVVIKGPQCLGERPEAIHHPDKLLTWLEATGWAYGDQGWGDLTLLPSNEGARTNRVDESGHILYGFHRTCTSLALKFIQLSPVTTLESFHDIWVIINARYSKDPVHHLHDSYAPSIPQKTGKGTYIWPKFKDYAPYYLAGRCSPTAYEWWKHDPLHIPDLTTRLLEKLQCRPVSSSIGESRFQNSLFNLPHELLEEIIDYLRYGSIDLQPTYLLSQSFWKQTFTKIPFLWDIDVQQVQHFPDPSGEVDKEWDWEHLVRQIMARPVKFQKPIHSVYHDSSLMLWDYGQVGLDVPLGLTNRRRIWQILEDMDLEELDACVGQDFFLYNDMIISEDLDDISNSASLGEGEIGWDPIRDSSW